MRILERTPGLGLDLHVRASIAAVAISIAASTVLIRLVPLVTAEVVRAG